MDTIQGHEAVGGATARGKPDPNVKLPPAIRAQAERAEALSKQAREAREVNDASGANTPIGQTQQVPTAKPFGAQGGAASVLTADFDPRNPNPPTDVPGAPSGATIAPAAPPAPAAPQAAQPQTTADWEHQFNSLKGRYDQETLNNRRLAAQLTDMQRLVANLSAPPPPVPQGNASGVRFNSPIAGPQQSQPQPLQPRVTDKEREEYGPELIDVMGRRAQEIYEQTILPQVIGELQQVKRQIGGVQNNQYYDAQVRMYDDLTREVPNWRLVNESSEFKNHWLNQIDPMSGQLRKNLLKDAHDNNQTERVVAAFKGFLSDVAASGLPAQGLQPGNGAGGYSQSYPTASTPQVDLMALAAPGRAKTGQTQVPPEKPIFNRTDISAFYRLKTAGKLAGREAEADAYERSFIEASNDGRVR